MTTFVVSYDLNKQKNYQKLWDELGRLGAHRALESLWLASANNTAKEIVDHLRGFVDNDDSLFVSELTRDHYYVNARAGTNNWIKANPPQR